MNGVDFLVEKILFLPLVQSVLSTLVWCPYPAILRTALCTR